MKLSIVIPVYKVEPYVERCIVSCIDPALIAKDYEIILVNDGTPDDSAVIAEKAITGVPGTRIIHKPNGGLSSARNSGLAVAKGDFVWFIDSDDYLIEGAVGKVLDALTDDLDMLEVQFQLVYEDGRQPVPKVDFVWPGVKSASEVMAGTGISTPAQFSIFKRSLLVDNDVRFMEGILHEDHEFTPRALFHARRCASLGEVVYNYLQRNHGSIMNSYKARNGLDSIKAIRSLIEFEKVHRTDNPVISSYFMGRVGLCFNCILNGMRVMTPDDRRTVLTEIKRRPEIMKAMRRSINRLYRVEGRLFAINPGLGFKFYKTIQKLRALL